MTDNERYVGLTENSASALAAMNHMTVRVRERDGVPYIGHANFNPSRLNFVVEDSIVVRVSRG